MLPSHNNSYRWSVCLQGEKAAWHLHGIEVQDQGSGRTWYFPCGRRLDRGNDWKQVLPLGRRLPLARLPAGGPAPTLVVTYEVTCHRAPAKGMGEFTRLVRMRGCHQHFKKRCSWSLLHDANHKGLAKALVSHSTHQPASLPTVQDESVADRTSTAQMQVLPWYNSTAAPALGNLFREFLNITSPPNASQVTTVTSDLRSAATTAQVWVDLQGSSGASGVQQLHSSAASFQRAQVRPPCCRQIEGGLAATPVMSQEAVTSSSALGVCGGCIPAGPTSSKHR